MSAETLRNATSATYACQRFLDWEHSGEEVGSGEIRYTDDMILLMGRPRIPFETKLPEECCAEFVGALPPLWMEDEYMPTCPGCGGTAVLLAPLFDLAS